MYIRAIKKRSKGESKHTEYLVRYMDKESAEGLSEQFMRFYGLKEILPGSYFYLGDLGRTEEFDWSGFQVQSYSN